MRLLLYSKYLRSKMKEQYQLTTDELKKEFNLTDFTQGLTSKEVQQKLASDGQNVLEVKPTPKWKIFLRQFNNIVIYILLVATLLTIIIGHYTDCLLYTSPSPRDGLLSRMPSSA